MVTVGPASAWRGRHGSPRPWCFGGRAEGAATGLHCGELRSHRALGRLNKSDRCCGFANLSMPWVAQLYANKNECLRLHITTQTGSNELVAIAPGTRRAWRNGAAGGPLLKIRTSASENGWFLVQVNQAAGTPGNSEFILRHARYAATNPNCASPSAPLPPP